MRYEYKCETCDGTTEIDVPIMENKPKRLKCEHCGTMTMYRVFGGSSIQIPFDWNDITYKFDKSPSGRKHFH